MKPVRILLLLVAYASFVVLGMFDGMLGVAWPSLRAAFLQPVDALGLLLAMTMTGHITASFISGRLITGWGLASLLVCSSALFVTLNVNQPVAFPRLST
jgi:fucose permease